MTSVASLPPASTPDALDALARIVTDIRRPSALTVRGGRVQDVKTTHIGVKGLERDVKLGSCVEVETDNGRAIGEVVAIHSKSIDVQLFSSSARLGIGAPVWMREELTLRPDKSWRGRVLNALGQPIDDGGPLVLGRTVYQTDNGPLSPLALDRVKKPVPTGVRAVDLFTPICAGQRIGIFAGSGVGKTTLVSMLTRAADFDTIVVALVAERGREVREFLEEVIEPHRDRTVTVVATSSDSAMLRKLSAKTAMTIAEHFRDQGDEVLLVVDSLTRFAHALREVALASGEPPVARGYTPSVFAELPRLLERAGPGRPGSGSITGIFSVLVDGDDHNDPISDAVRGILDGHIVLDRSIAEQGRFPAIDPLRSISRLAQLAWSQDEAELVRRLRSMIARYEDTRDLRSLGAYKPGADPELDQVVLLVPEIYRLLVQLPKGAPTQGVFAELAEMLREVRGRMAKTADEADSAPLRTARTIG